MKRVNDCILMNVVVVAVAGSADSEQYGTTCMVVAHKLIERPLWVS